MGPDKECCAACDGANVVGCSFKGESECRPLKAKPRTVRTYNPATHIVVSRETAQIARAYIPHMEGCASSGAIIALAELRAALEDGR